MSLPAENPPTPPTAGASAARRLGWLYAVALSIIAGLAIGGQVLIQRALTIQSEDGGLINEAGRQRMLSQRIVMSVLALRDETDATLRQRRIDVIAGALETWSGTAARLEAHAVASSGRDGLADLLHKARVPMERMVASAQRVVTNAAVASSVAPNLLTDEEQFLPLMDSIVYWLELDSNRRVSMLRRLEIGLMVVTLVVLALEAALIFRPAGARLRTTMDQLEFRQQQARKRLDSLRHLAGGLAHHFNNLLFGVTGYAELLKHEAHKHDRSVEYLDAQLANCHRAMQLTNQLLAYSGYGKLNLKPVSLGELVRDSIAEVAEESPRAPAVALEIREDTKVSVDDREVKKAVVGLIANAVESMEGRPGAVRVVVSQTIVDEPKVAAGPYRQELPPGLYARVRIIDRGTGMTAAQLEKIFDPFYSTKMFGRGLGMAAVLGIAHGHGGGVVVRSQVNEGSEATLYLPVQPADQAPTDSLHSLRNASSGSI